jgi:protein-tyrosine phosphatase
MKVLFVCHGNINRSPSAEIIARQLMPHWQVRSCGLKTWQGRITSKKMRETLNRRGYPTQGIRSTPITAELVEWADRIFYMDGGNQRRFLAEFGAMPKAQRLSDYTASVNSIPDPTWCKDYTVHEQLVDLLEEALLNIDYDYALAA